MARALIFCGLIAAIACQRPEEGKVAAQPTAAEVQERLIEQNRDVLKQERAFISRFVDSTGWPFEPAGSGALEWKVQSGSAAPVQEQELLRINYRLSGLRGEEFGAGIQEVRVLRDAKAVWGLQYALARARHGDSLLLLLPAHLGHGLAGDGEVPPMSPLLYYLRVL